MPDTLVVENLTASAGSFHVNDANLSVKPGEIFVVVGPSGAGKTVLLESIGGFHRIRKGRIEIGGRDVTRLPAHRRGVALIFQDYALFPHMTVRKNILFGTKYRGENYERGRFDTLVEALELGSLLDRSPLTLSGGEAQRVAIARALVLRPSVLLADEAFGALDIPKREQLRVQFLNAVREFGQAVLFVTHDRTEAYQMATRMAVMRDGRIVQTGTPDEVYYRPGDAEVAEFIGVETLLKGKVKGGSEGVLAIDVGGSEVCATGERTAGEEVTLCIRADVVALSTGESSPATSVRNIFRGTVTKIVTRGPVVYVDMDCGFPVKAAITRLSLQEMKIDTGSQVGVSFKAIAVHVL